MNMHAIIHAKRERAGYYVAFLCFCNFLRKNTGNITRVEKDVEIVQNPVCKGFGPVVTGLFFA